ncbi:TetR family transcriptional regulator [Tannerella sp. oral taxon BU063 isolate Cell 2]|uniref:TetR family transcriptional regulator n=1 Tax=Tannerella sp. oral taxon BU063 isolate Cell 2 TaxID=1411148 RepID=W2C0V4_9BACT|nr:TetR family transcriptional regulator [Tannerella sp. oral taxon BU063 isolate Cell 2]
MAQSKTQNHASILQAARAEFLERGFQDTSMRTIARLSGVTLSNIYNYFRDKDTLFRAVLQPLLDSFEDLLARHNSDYYLTTDVYSMKSYQEHMLNEFMRLPQHFRAELRLLLFHAAGSSLEYFRDTFCERQTREGIRYIRLMKERYPDRVTGDVSPFFLRTVSSLWLTVMGEIVRHDELSEADIERFLSEYLAFGTAGWKALLGL